MGSEMSLGGGGGGKVFVQENGNMLLRAELEGALTLNGTQPGGAVQATVHVLHHERTRKRTA